MAEKRIRSICSVRQLSDKIKSGEIKPTELIDMSIKRIIYFILFGISDRTYFIFMVFP